MRYLRPLALTAVFALTLLPALTVRGQQRGETLAWAPVPVKPNAWVAPNKAHWKLSELLAAHKGQASWKATVVSDNLLRADYIQMASGTKVPKVAAGNETRCHRRRPEKGKPIARWGRKARGLGSSRDGPAASSRASPP